MGETELSDPQPYEIAGVLLPCRHCGRNLFHHRQAVLDRMWLPIIDLDVVTQRIDLFVCGTCGYCQHFLDPWKLRVLEISAPEKPIECLSCHASIPSCQTGCDQCGWTYQ
jgi:hypothetical protein